MEATQPQPPPSATGVRTAGDRYQWMHVWRACLQVLRDNSPTARPENPSLSVGVELDNTGNLDDVVLMRTSPPHDFAQVKYAVDASSPIGLPFLTTKNRTGQTLLGKLAKSRRDLADQGLGARLALISNRFPDPSSSLLAGLDPRTGLLMPKAALQGPTSKRGRERADWAKAAELTEAELLDLLSELRFDIGWTPQRLQDHLSILMTLTGLKGDDGAIRTATTWVAEKVIAGERQLDLATIQAAAEDLGLHAGKAWASISIACMKPDPVADQAVHAVDWVQRFEGDNAFEKRRPLPPYTWDEFAAELEAAALAVSGHDALMVTGSLRQATGFALGARLRMVTGMDLAIQQGAQTWSSSGTYGDPLEPLESWVDLEGGTDLAVVVSIATNATDDVVAWINETSLPVSRVLTLSPPSGSTTDQSIPNATAAVALAVGIRNVVRSASRGYAQVHLFLAGPLGLALLLGHRWNRVPPTTVYEDLVHAGYQAAFQISA